MALDFNGTSNYLIATQSVLTGGNCSFGAWFRCDQDTANQVAMSIGNASGFYHRHQITFAGGVASDPVRLTSIYSTGASVGDVDKVGFVAGTWVHVLAVIQTTPSVSRNIYVNGSAGTANTTSFTMDAFNRFVIAGREAGGVGAFFDGKIAEPCFWAATLTAADALSLASGASSLLVRPDAIRSYPALVNSSRDIKGFSYTAGGSPAAYAHPRIFYPSP